MGLRERLRRADWLYELQATLIGALVLVVAGVVVGAGLSLAGPLVVEVPSDHVVTAGAVTGLTAGVVLARDGTVDVRLDDPSAGQAALGLLRALPTGLVVVAMLVLLLQVVRHARRHDPFTAVTVRRLRRLAAVVVVGGPLAWAAETTAGFMLAGTVTEAGSGGTFSPLAPLTWVLVGFGYLAVAEVVNRGRAMRAELDEVI